MMAQRHGLIVNATFWDRGEYLGSLPYDLAKTAVNRMAHGMALELRP
jgi:NAD(P)-dependent dehydrogenase (short-subunit alcohol dehydrogenase family)